MSGYTKLFSQMGELDSSNKLKFSDFERLNDFLEKNPLLSYTDLYNSYVKVVLDIGSTPDFTSYSELDFQVKYLVDEIKVPLNRVLDYAKLKFGGVIDLLKLFFSSIPQIKQENIDPIIEVVNIIKKGDISIELFVTTSLTPENYVIHFDVDGKPEDLHKKIKECFDKMNLERAKKGEIIGIGVSV